MKKLNLCLLVFTILFFISKDVSAQVTVSNAGTANGTYTSLTQAGGAFAALNAAGSQAGNAITVSISGDVTTEDGSNGLNAGNWVSLSIASSGIRTVAGAVAGPMINLNGASNIIIDGLNDGTNSLLLSNTATGAASTLQFVNDASGNMIRNCTITGSATSTTSAVIVFGSGTSTGCVNNTISHCNITAAGANLPVNGIYANSSNAAAPNSNNIIADNNIYDFFSAGQNSEGVLLNQNNPAWTISGNSFYQTATRTATAAVKYTAIETFSTGAGATFSGNFIGGSAPACAGSAWTIDGTSSCRFLAISVAAGAATSDFTEIQGNTIANINFQSAGTNSVGNFVGIGVTTAGHANIGTVTGNTIGSATGTGSITITSLTTAAYASLIYCTGLNKTFNIKNNTIGSITLLASNTTNSQSVRGIYVVNGIPAVMNNVIGSLAAPNSINAATASTATTQEVTGISMSGLSDNATMTVEGNAIANLNQGGTGAAHTITGIKVANITNTVPVTVAIKNNNISNLSGANSNTMLASLALGTMGIQFAGTNGVLCKLAITGNTVHGISNTNTGALGINVCGIGVTAMYRGITSKNIIYDLRNAATGIATATPPTVSGILIRATTLIDTVCNNMISLGNGQTTNTEFIGIWSPLSNALANIQYNSINIEGTVAAGSLRSFALFRGDNAGVITSTLKIYNNIFNNTRTGGTGSHYAVGNSYPATASTTGWTANNNAFNAANTATIAYWSADRDFATYKTVSAGDAFSVSAVAVPFTNTATADLHLGFGATPTQLESGAVAIPTITDDIDGQVRPGPAGSANGGGNSPDIGADEIDAVPLDLFPPVITYTALPRGLCLAGRTLVATITDNINVNTSTGTAPRLYYKKSTDADTYAGNTSAVNGWKYVEASNSGNQYTFNINYALLFGGGVSVGNTIQYFVVAQDMAAPNVGINSGVFAATPASVNLTASAFPISGTVNSYVIGNGLSGTVTVGAGGTYTDLTGAAGLFAAINTLGLSGDLTASIISNITEPGTTSLTQMVEGCSTYYLTIKPNAAGRVITASLTADATIRILSNHVIIDGQSSAAFTRDLTIANTAATSPFVVLFGSTGTVPVTDCVLKNCIITDGANSTTSSYAVVLSDGSAIYSPGYFSNILIQNNIIQKANTGILCVGLQAAGNGNGVNINSNIMTTSGTNAINEYGIFLSNIDGASVKYNTLSNFDATDNATDAGIAVYNSTNTIIAGNTISNIGGTGSFSGGHGIYITSVAANYNSGMLVYNNSISGIFGEGWDYSSTPLSNPIGIALDGSQSGIGIYHNTISLSGNTLTQANALSMGMYIGTGSSVDMRDNIIVNKQGLAAATGYGATAVYAKTGSSQFSAIDYNDYYVNPTGSGVKLIGQIGSTAAGTLAAMQTATGQDTYSLNVQPVFISSTNLHLATSGNCALDGYGTPVAQVTSDIDLQARDLGDPDMGIDEFTDTYNAVLANSSYNNTISITKNLPAAGGTFIYTDCNIMAAIFPSGASPVSGEIKVSITRDPSSTNLFYNAAPYVTRHYDIEPVNNAASATGTVTLYFTDQEFIDYNNNNPLWPPLPTSTLGDSDPNRANVKITQYHGTPLTSPSGPNQYSAGTTVYIDPADGDVHWNGNFWAVSFNATGFSGFYLYTSYIAAPLPIILNYLRGTKQGTIHNLNWSVTCNTTPTAILALERSANGVDFAAINTITATALRCQQPFDYADVTPLAGINYYRLKMTDTNGKFTYSNIVTLINAAKGLDIMNIAPNPVTGPSFKLNVSSAKASPMLVVITDMQGRVVSRQAVTLTAGFNSLDMRADNLAAGTYNLYGTTVDDKTKVIRFVKN